MYPVFETIKVIDGRECTIDAHIERMNRTARLLWGKSLSFPDLIPDLRKASSSLGLHKCKVKYNEISYSIECTPYTKRSIRKLHIIGDDSLMYFLKLSDRTCFTKYTTLYPEHDDIIIVKDNRLTDTSFSNIALWNGVEWHTPAFPLLKGTKRQYLLEKGQLVEKDIVVSRLHDYKKISLINAMLDIGETEIDIRQLSMG